MKTPTAVANNLEILPRIHGGTTVNLDFFTQLNLHPFLFILPSSNFCSVLHTNPHSCLFFSTHPISAELTYIHSGMNVASCQSVNGIWDERQITVGRTKNGLFLPQPVSYTNMHLQKVPYKSNSRINLNQTALNSLPEFPKAIDQAFA